VILFDGVCNLCNGFVQFVIERDPVGRFRFGPLQSAAARELIAAGAASGTMLDSLVLVEGGRVFRQSSAALRVLRRLTFPWPLAYVLIVVPSPFRDWIYRIVARNRYRWFGRRDACMVPTPALRQRFIDADRPQHR
jgi:predicted DCC family thiol-disulfide oxidoreductase YuxK